MPWLEDTEPRLFYAEAGQGGLPLLHLHGHSCDHGFMRPQLEHFGAGRRVVAMDLRGHGQSGLGPAYGVADMAQDAARLLGALCIGRAAVVGHSLGGMVALELAAQHPGLVAGVAALDSALLNPEGQLAKLLPWLLERMAAPDYLATLRALFAGQIGGALEPAQRQALLTRMAATPPEVVSQGFKALAAWDGAQALKALRAPLLYVAAGRPRSDLKEMARLVPGLVVELLPQCGHFCHLQEPTAVNAALERFLEGLK